MAKKKVKFDPNKALLKSGLYATKATKPRSKSGPSALALNKAAGASIEKAKKLAEIEAYAKANGISVAKAMIELM